MAGDVERILVVGAHPDDVDFGVAGSTATWTAQGVEVAYCIVTDGDAGGSEYGVARAEMAELRRAEQCAAAEVVGVQEVHFLGYPDGRLQATLALRHDLTRVVRRVRPQRVVCQSPERNYARIYASHPDHLAAGEATLCAVYPDARNRWAHPELLDEGLDPWVVPEVWLAAHPRPDQYVDVTAAIDRKLAALRCHASQLPDPEATAEMVRGWGRTVAAAGGMPDGTLAEAFLRVDTL